MSEFHIRVVEIGTVTKHPNADALECTVIGGDGGYPVIMRSGSFREGQRAVYVPVGAAVPADDPRWSFLVKPGSTKPYVEIDAKRLRGVFSMGLLTDADPSWEVGRDVRAELRIERAEEVEAAAPTNAGDGESISDPRVMPLYTDIEGMRHYPHVLIDGEEVVVSEKLHGESSRYALAADGTLCVGSHTKWKRIDGASAWAVVARRIGLAERLARVPGIGVFGECYGNVAGMRYDATAGERGLRLFDAMDLRTREYLDYDAFVDVAARMDLPTVPVLYRGAWSTDLRALADGPSTLNPLHVREGIVVRPTKERREHFGRVCLKLHSTAYLLKQWAIKPTK